MTILQRNSLTEVRIKLSLVNRLESAAYLGPGQRGILARFVREKQV